MTDHLLVDKSDGVATITFNRPEARNALSVEMRGKLIESMLEIERDDDIRCVVLRGAGDNFMAGGDLKNFAELAELSSEQRYSHFEQRIHTIQPLLISMQRMQKPVVAVVQGAAAGFGFSLAMACDMVLAAENARFVSSYVAIGASPDGSGTYYLPRLVGLRRAMEIVMLGEFIQAPEALEMGLVNRVIAEENLEEEAQTLVKRLVRSPTVALGQIKNLMYASSENSLEQQMSREAESFAECAASADWVEGVAAFNEKRKPRYQGR